MLVAARTHDYGKQPVDHLAKLLISENAFGSTSCAAKSIFGDQFL